MSRRRRQHEHRAIFVDYPGSGLLPPPRPRADNLPPGYVVTNDDLKVWYGQGRKVTAEDDSGAAPVVPTYRPPTKPPEPAKRPGFWGSLWDSVKAGDLSPSSTFGQTLVHGTYWGSDFLQDDRRLAAAQSTALKIGVGAAVAVGTGGLGLIAGGVVSEVTVGVAERTIDAGSAGASLDDALISSLDARQIVLDAGRGAATAGVLKVAAPVVGAAGSWVGKKVLSKVRGKTPPLSGGSSLDDLAPSPSAGGVGSRSPCNCFAGGTLVWTQEGLRPIETIEKGDLVLAWDEQSGQTALKPVVQTFETPGQVLLELVVDHREAGERIVTTPGHPFWVEQLGWTHAAKLTLQSDLLSIGADESDPASWVAANDGKSAPLHELSLRSRVPLSERGTVYNLTVDGFHTYFVGESGALVHNTSPCDWSPGGAFSTVAAEARVFPTPSSTVGTSFGTRVQLLFKGKSADMNYIEELLDGTNRGLARRPGVVGNQLEFDSALSNQFLREYFGTRTLREALLKKAALEKHLGRKLAVDEIVPRQLGGPQVFSNQRLIPSGVNGSLGRVEQLALKELAPGTRVLGFDPVFVGH